MLSHKNTVTSLKSTILAPKFFAHPKFWSSYATRSGSSSLLSLTTYLS